VALLDDGVDIDEFYRSAFNLAGIESFAPSEVPSPLKPPFLSGSGRGTKMANLVVSTYPGSLVYIARVNSDIYALSAVAQV
jgi:hypothetical protein